ncbi:helix-turn-helix transcriptional regulator [Azospirillum sp. B21]|uniref:helix-turn-helix transcriptional regulator n=1 Tax=Azospirillum sp. B21 TaxID=2607496 RepID=UPI0011EFD3BB|nr:helix-turn-helix transcriptional regulator [Azospirillum sp. B21]KAA0574384.1 helix-turn-helix transcriptional regulator [Azospirillum sp. B21]
MTLSTQPRQASPSTESARAFSRNAVLLGRLLGAQVRLARRKKRWSEVEAAERARVSRATLQKIERGSPGVTLGLVLEVCSVVGVPLFGTTGVADLLERTQLELAAQPKRIRAARSEDPVDDF